MRTFTSCSLAITSGSFSKFLGKAGRRIPAFLFQQRGRDGLKGSNISNVVHNWVNKLIYSSLRNPKIAFSSVFNFFLIGFTSAPSWSLRYLSKSGCWRGKGGNLGRNCGSILPGMEQKLVTAHMGQRDRGIHYIQSEILPWVMWRFPEFYFTFIYTPKIPPCCACM